jgi:hypothetical protein
MADDVKSFLELKPEASGAAPASASNPPSPAAGSVRWSLITFILGVAGWIGTVILAPFAIYAGGDMFKSNDALVAVGLVLILAGTICLLISIVCGCLALKHRRVVLWWVIPSVLFVGFLGFIVVSIVSSL